MTSASPHDSLVEATPPRREPDGKSASAGADLIDDLLAPGETVMIRDLLPLIERFEANTGRDLVDAAGKDVIRGFAAGAEGAMELGHEEMGALLRSLLPSATPPSPTSDDDADRAFVDVGTPAAPRPNRRVSSSGRIRSQSDTDSTSASESDASLRGGSPGFGDGNGDAASPAGGIAFPSGPGGDSGGGGGASSRPPSAFGGRRRTTTTSDPARPQGMGVRAPPSAFGYAGAGAGAGRPTPPAMGKKKLRRGSDGSMRSPMNEGGRYGAGASPLAPGDEATYTLGRSRTSSGVSSTGAPPITHAYSTPTVTRPKPPRPSHRRRSSAYSAAAAAAGSASASQPWSPAADGTFSPGVDGRSFVGMSARDAMRSPDHFGLDDEGDDEGRTKDPRSMRLATSSTTSLQLTHDQMQALERANAEYVRKNQELQRQLQIVGNDNESRIAELQDRLDEAKSDLAIKRKEEKDLRIKEKTMNIQLAELEADLANLQRSLDLARAAQADLHKSYTGQLAETDRLRKTVLDREEELSGQKRALDSHEADKGYLNDNIQELEAQLRNAQESLQIARQAEVELQRQKQENLNLKETISRLNYDIDEMRVQSAAGHSRQATSSLSGTVSKNLGAEIARSMNRDAAETSPGADGKAEETVRTVYKTVTIHTERVIQAEGSTEAPRTIVEEIATDYVDAGTETDPLVMVSTAAQTDISMASELPPYTQEPLPSAADILRAAHPAQQGRLQRITLPSMADLQTDYASISLGLGLRCQVIEDAMAEAQATTLREVPLLKQGRAPAQAEERAREAATVKSEVVTALQVLFATATAPDRLWILPMSFVAIGAMGYLLGQHTGALPANAVNEILLMRDIKNIALGPPHYLSGTWVLKAIGGATHVVGRVPM